MTKVWTDGFTTFKNRDVAFGHACCEMTWDDIEKYFRKNMTFHSFFTRVRENIPNFFEVFEDEWCEAENEYFNENYHEEEGDEIEEE